MTRTSLGSFHPRPGSGARHLTSHLVLVFAALLTLASGVVFTMDGVDVDVDSDGFAFQLGGINVVAAMFTRASATPWRYQISR
jgi:hypothetical protein